ncbi:MAG: hypothetical protein H0Z37_05290 [Firmicutes bacterium]|nr:hypothetical protein [Bacillota bacterium]
MSPEGSRILAVITTREGVVGGGVPVFLVASEKERDQVSVLLSRILQAVVHDLQNGVYVIVRH